VSRIVHLVRHGSHDEVGRVLSGRSAIALNARGREEAAALARWARGRPIGAVVSSPRPRTRETAEILAGPLGLAVTTHDALDEIDFGRWAGMAFAHLDGDPLWHEWNANRASTRAPGGETMAEAVARARMLVERTEAGETLAVSHCDVIRGLVATYLGIGFDRLLAFDCDPASVTTLAIDAAGVRLVTLNARSWPPA
jgi:broad specificity phosphatase PhoE